MGGRSGRSSGGRVAIAAALVLVGCYLGACADAWLRFPGVGAAILVPQYAIVTAALWRTSPRVWAIFLLAASAGNVVPHHLGGESLGFVLAAELVNHFRAVLAALGLRRWAGRSGRVETMREMVAYLAFAVFLAPALAALAGTGLVVSVGQSQAAWLVWREWWLSSAITGLTLLPLFALDVRQLAGGVPVSARRAAESLLLVISMGAAGTCLLARVNTFSPASQLHLYWAVPTLLWAAVRFGPRVTSAALLGITLISIWGVVAGRGAFAAQSPAENLLELQTFLLAVSFPSLLLSALIQQQRLTAAALLESRRQYRSVVEDQTEMICRFRPDGIYTFANRAYCEAFGRRADELVGGSIWRLVPEVVHRGRADLALIVPASPLATREVNVAREGEPPRWQQWRDRGFFDERGQVVEYQAVGCDVTDRKRVEDERRELEARKSVEAALREADRRKDEFLAMLGHELRNPLAPIAIALEILRLAPAGSADALWARDSIGRQLTQMTRLLDDLFDVSRVKLGKIRLRWEMIDVARVIASAVEETRPLIESFGHTLTISLPNEPMPIRGDAARLTQVVANLMNNAAKYTDHGGRIDVSVARDGDELRIAVRDNGIGIEVASLEGIFELFSQLRGSAEHPNGGLGIGLALVRRLVELHGGTVEARSEGAGRGTELIVRLPATGVPATVERQSSAPLSLRSGDDRGASRRETRDR
jgi:PAS domain S-box-containing protein